MSQRRRRSLAFLTSGVLALPLLAGCGAGDEEGGPVAAGQDIAMTSRDRVADGGVVRWAVDTLPDTLNTFQADADATTARIAGAVLPQLFVMDAKGQPVANPDYLEKAEIVAREPKQVVLYKLNQQAVWSDGREIGAADFVAQWRALNGKDSAYWTARNAGYERIEKIERGKTDLEVKVTFAKPYTDWRSLFTPLYPKQVTGTPDAFNEGARGALKVTAGAFNLGAVDKKTATVALTRNARWWGRPAKLDTLVLTAVPRAERPAALAAGKLDMAEIDRTGADRIALAHRDAKAAKGAEGAGGAPAHGPGASVTAAQATMSWAIAYGADESKAKEEQASRAANAEAAKKYAEEQNALRTFAVRKSLEPAYTQLAMNGASGPLADERVRRAVARALDRKALAEIVLKPLGLPAKPVGSHLALAGQPAYADNSDALGGQDTQAAQALLADAGWRRGGKITEPAGAKAGPEASSEDDGKTPSGPGTGNDGLYVVGQDDERNGDERGGDERAGDEQGGAGNPQDARLAAGPGLSPALTVTPLAAQQQASLLAQADVARAAAGPDAARDTATTDTDAKGRPGPRGRRGRAGEGLGGARPGQAGPYLRQHAGQGRQGAQPALRPPLGPRLGVAARGRRAHRPDAPEGRHPGRAEEGRRRELLQGPHRLGPVRPGALLLARDRLPGHRRAADLRQAGAGRRRLAPRRTELHPGRHRPYRPAVRPGPRRAGRGGLPRSDPQGGRPDLGRRRIHPALPASRARGGQAQPGQRGCLRPRRPPFPGHRLEEVPGRHGEERQGEEVVTKRCQSG